MVVPHVEDLGAHVGELLRRLRDTDRWYQPRVQRVDDLSLRLRGRLSAIGTEAGLRVKAVESALGRIKPDRVIEMLRIKLHAFEASLLQATRRVVQDRNQRVAVLAQGVARALSKESVQQRRYALVSLSERLAAARLRIIDDHLMRLKGVCARLEAVSPQAVLNRGFGIVYSRGVHIRSVASVKEGASLDIRVADGVISGLVQSSRRE
jgi:exodeoxyribonuclease VII large subunit